MEDSVLGINKYLFFFIFIHLSIPFIIPIMGLALLDLLCELRKKRLNVSLKISNRIWYTCIVGMLIFTGVFIIFKFSFSKPIFYSLISIPSILFFIGHLPIFISNEKLLGNKVFFNKKKALLIIISISSLIFMYFKKIDILVDNIGYVLIPLSVTAPLFLPFLWILLMCKAKKRYQNFAYKLKFYFLLISPVYIGFLLYLLA